MNKLAKDQTPVFVTLLAAMLTVSGVLVVFIALNKVSVGWFIPLIAIDAVLLVLMGVALGKRKTA